jgi:hypothetical protein
MTKWLRAGVLFAALPAVSLLAADLESLHAFNVSFGLSLGWTLQLHARARTFENVGEYNQLRAGPILIWQASRRFTSLSGYYLTDQNTRLSHQRFRVHRPWWAGQYRLVSGEKWALDGRAAVERMLSARFDDYWRGHARIIVSRATPIGHATATSEGLRERGVWYGRLTAGLQWKLQKNVTFGTGYEYRDAARGRGSHVIATTLNWDARPAPPARGD